MSSRQQTESDSDEKPYIWFSMGIDYSSPYIHSTTVLCDTDSNILCLHRALHCAQLHG